MGSLGALAWSVPLSADVTRAVGTLDDDVVALLSLDVDSRGLFPAGSLDKQHWSNIVTQPGVLLTEHWLLAYEANHQKWLASPAVAKHAEFKAMEKAGVSFYDRAENRPQVPSAAGGHTRRTSFGLLRVTLQGGVSPPPDYALLGFHF
jgi:hypothetical protein